MTILSNPASSEFSKALELKRVILQGFASFKQLKYVHAQILRFGLGQDNYLLNMILKHAFASGHTNYSRLVFTQTKDPNIFLWNTVIRGLVFNDCFDEAVKFYRLMRKEGLVPNSFVFPFVLKACSRIGDFPLGQEIHSLLVKVDLDYDVFVRTSLVSLYAKCGHLEVARLLFDDMSDKNIVSWTAIIAGYVDAGRSREAIEMFRRLLEIGLSPDTFTLVRVLSACSQIGDAGIREWIHRCIIELGMEKNVFVGTSLVDVYVKCGNMEIARSIFNGLPEKDIVSWSSMIQGYAANGMPKEALDVFFLMHEANVKPDCYSMVGVLSACASLGAVAFGEWAIGLLARGEFLCNPIMGTALIDMYAKWGNTVSAWRVFKDMKERDLVLWNAIISGLCMNGHVKSAFSLFGQVEKYGIKPDGNTFIGLLCGCTHAGLVAEGRRYFYSMNRVYSLTPGIEHYGCMVDLLGRSGLLDEAHKLIKGMPMAANAIVWGALLNGCRTYKNPQLAEYVLKKLIELEPWSSGNYVLLSNIYSANCRWDDAERIRSRMIEKGIQKPRACSWIEVDGVVHEFLVGDKSHFMSDVIYAKLDELNKELRVAGYVPTTEFVLFDIEEEEKEQFLGYHSEKLAIAYGLLGLPSESVIRVVKNLRVCGDCHVFIKLVSKITGRGITVRDNNRFHYFVEGSCSCNDYW